MRKLQAFSENTLPQHEIEDGMQQESEACHRNMLQREIGRRTKEKNVLRAEKGCSRADSKAAWGGQKVYLTVPANMHLVQGISDMGLVVTSQASAATVIVCSKPGHMQDPRLRLLAGLQGCYEVAPSFFLTGQGAVLKRRAAAAIKRVLIVSKACAKKCPKFWRFLRSCLPENHKWTMAKTALSAIRAAHGREEKCLGCRPSRPAKSPGHSRTPECVHDAVFAKAHLQQL